MVFLRELKKKDALLMLEWMHDEEIQRSFQKNMLSCTLEQAELFCENANIHDPLSEGQSIHYAIADETDEYIGTISLKNISLSEMSAEYAISTRRCAHGKGMAKEATLQLLEKAFGEYGLKRVYLNVLVNNEAAIHLYESCGFTKYEGDKKTVTVSGKEEEIIWYHIDSKKYRGER